MTKAVATKETTAVATEAPASPINVNMKDLVLPKLLLQQGSSAGVNEGKYANGDIVNNLTGEKIGDKTKSVEILPLSYNATWTVLEKGSGKFVKSIPYQKGVELDYEEKLPDGKIVNNYYTINVYCLIVKDLSEGMALPALISFRSKSLVSGKKLITSHFLFCQMNNAPAYAKTVILGCAAQKNDKGSFHIFTTTPGKKATPEQMTTAKMWESTLRSANVKIADEGDGESDGVDTATTDY